MDVLSTLGFEPKDALGLGVSIMALVVAAYSAWSAGKSSKEAREANVISREANKVTQTAYEATLLEYCSSFRVEIVEILILVNGEPSQSIPEALSKDHLQLQFRITNTSECDAYEVEFLENNLDVTQDYDAKPLWFGSPVDVPAGSMVEETVLWPLRPLVDQDPVADEGWFDVYQLLTGLRWKNDWLEGECRVSFKVSFSDLFALGRDLGMEASVVMESGKPAIDVSAQPASARVFDYRFTPVAKVSTGPDKNRAMR